MYLALAIFCSLGLLIILYEVWETMGFVLPGTRTEKGAIPSKRSGPVISSDLESNKWPELLIKRECPHGIPLKGDYTSEEFYLEALKSWTAKTTERFPGALRWIGRDNSVDLQLSDPLVSRFHALITGLSDKGFLLLTDNSENGSYVNGKRITRQVITEGDIIQIGNQRFRVEAGCLIWQDPIDYLSKEEWIEEYERIKPRIPGWDAVERDPDFTPSLEEEDFPDPEPTLEPELILEIVTRPRKINHSL